jgi:hypothetical protein
MRPLSDSRAEECAVDGAKILPTQATSPIKPSRPQPAEDPLPDDDHHSFLTALLRALSVWHV